MQLRKLLSKTERDNIDWNTIGKVLGSGFLVALIGSALLNTAFSTAWSTLYASPTFTIIVPTGLSSAEILNDGHAAAHNVLITVRTEGDERFRMSEFSSENYTLTSPRYDPISNTTLVVFQLKRMAPQALVTLTLKAYSGKSIEIWVNADETGAHYMAVRGVCSVFPALPDWACIVFPAFPYWNYVVFSALIATELCTFIIVWLWRKQIPKLVKAENGDSKTEKVTTSPNSCVKCGKELPSNSKFCNECGVKQP